MCLAASTCSSRRRSPAGSLPPGSQRLLGIARALAIRPRYLLLDEPAAGLNEAECDELVAILRGVLADFGCGILLIEHDMSVVMQLCSRVQVLDDGRHAATRDSGGDPGRPAPWSSPISAAPSWRSADA